jgi:hypothetical protein
VSRNENGGTVVTVLVLPRIIPGQVTGAARRTCRRSGVVFRRQMLDMPCVDFITRRPSAS